MSATVLIAEVGNTVRSTVEARVLDQWRDAGVLRTAVQLPAMPKLHDTDGSFLNEPPRERAWLKVEIQPVDTEVATISPANALNRTTGIIQVSVYVPAGKGTVELETLKGLARLLFSRFDGGGGLRCRASGPGPNLKDDPWLVGIIKTEFEVYERHT